MGRDVTVIDPGPDPDDEFFPKARASVCLEGPPQRQCYTTYEPAMDASASVVLLRNDEPAIFFESHGGGVSGFVLEYVLLQPSDGKELETLLHVRVSNQNQHAFWTVPTISDRQIFVIADYVWGPNESHYSDHRYIIRAYVMKPDAEFPSYYLEDEYMTVRRYDLDENEGILAAEKEEILRRLRITHTEP